MPKEVQGDVGVVKMRANGVVVANKIVAENKLGSVVAAKQSGEQHKQMERERERETEREKERKQKEIGMLDIAVED